MKNILKDLRKEKPLSQEALAKACHVSRQTINAIENDKYDPSLDLAFKLATVLEKPIEQIFIHNFTKD